MISSKPMRTFIFNGLGLKLLTWVHKHALTFVSIALVLVIWTYLAKYVINPLLLPTPLAVLQEAITMLRSGELQTNIAASLQRIFFGYLNGCAWGILIGLAVGRTRLARGLVMPALNLVRPISPVAMVPLIIVWFGIGEFAKIVLVGYTTFIVVLFNTMTGVASTPVIRERAARCLGANEIRVFRYVVIPSAIPHILTGMRIGLGFSFMSVVASELIAANSGIGFLIMQSRFSMLTVRMFVGLASLGFLGYLGDLIFRYLIVKWGHSYLGSEMNRAF